jgi:citrate synthase
MRACVQARLKAIKKAHGTKKLGEATVDFALGGMRGIPVSRWPRHCCLIT